MKNIVPDYRLDMVGEPCPSPDLKNWQFVGYAFDEGKSEYTSEGVCECPSRALIDGKEVLFYSPQFMPYTG